MGNKAMMSRADLVHLLDDSIEKTSKKKKDQDINQQISKTKRFIQKSKQLDKEMNVPTENQPKLRRADLN